MENEDENVLYHSQLWHPIIDVILFIFAIDDVVHM